MLETPDRRIEPPSAAAGVDRLAAAPRLQTLPHEWAFGGFLLLTSLRLARLGPAGIGEASLFLMLFLGGIAIGIWASRQPTPLRWRLRLLWYPCAMGIAFYAFEDAIPLLGLASADPQLAAWDLALLGRPVSAVFGTVQSAALTDVLTCAYLLFFFYLLLGPAYYCIRDLQRFRACFVGLFTVYALGFTGYTLLPASGPLHAGVALPLLPAHGFAEAMRLAVDRASNGFDVFPSLHVAVTMFLLGFDRQHFRSRFRTLLLPCVLLWISTVYLQYHYLVDVMAGAAVAAFGLLVTALYQRSALAVAVDLLAAAAIAERRGTR